MKASKTGSISFLFHGLTVLAGTIASFNTLGSLARADSNPQCAAPELYDLDGSGVVAPADVLALIDGMNGPEPQSERFDIDGSGVVDEQDVVTLTASLQACRSAEAAIAPSPAAARSSALIPQARITLVPPGPGPYPPGAQLSFVVTLERLLPASDVYLRLAQIDYGLTNPLITLQSFIWDYSSTPWCMSNPSSCGSGYFSFPFSTIYSIVYIGLMEDTAKQLRLPGDGSPLTLGSLTVTMPEQDGTFLLDVLNASSVGSDFGARLDFGFNNHITWLANQGEIIGGQLSLVVDLNVECVSGTPCEPDDNDCTDDVCVDGQCTHPYSKVGTPCGLNAGLCAPPGGCDGAGFCLQHPAEAGTVCRPAVSDCDVTEFCNGQSFACPPNGVRPPGTPCTSDGNDCTSDTCMNGVCQHESLPFGTPCGNQTSIGDCHLNDTCNGGGACLSNYVPDTTVCRAALNECDRTEFCSGLAPDCGPDLFFGAGTPCGNQQPQGACDAADVCDGAGDCSPNFITGGPPCRAAVSECDQSESCSGQSPVCPVDSFVSAGAPCSDDTDECTDDACDGAGQCAHPQIDGCRDIPTVSTWGLTLMTLLLLIAAKVRFARTVSTSGFCP